MKTMRCVKDIMAENRSAYFEMRDNLRENVAQLESIYAHSTTGEPSDMVNEFVAAVGIQKAVEIIATLINRHSDDDRLTYEATIWAKMQPNSWSTDAAEKMGIKADRIHRFRLNQMAEYLMTISQ